MRALALVLVLLLAGTALADDARDEYRKRAQTLDPKDAEGHHDLAIFCVKHGLKELAILEFKKVIEIDPDHENARRALGYVRQGDRWVSRLEPDASAGKTAREAEKLLRDAAYVAATKEARAKAREKLVALDAAAVRPVLLKRLELSDSSEERRLAAELLGETPHADSVRGLARRIVLDGIASVRSQSFDSLKKIHHPDTGLVFVDALSREDPRERIRASDALRTFPRKEAVAALAGGGGGSRGPGDPNGSGRSHIFIGSDRAYISGYDLSAGGTGFSVAEVASPEIATIRDGVVLEVRARYITQYEWIVQRGVLRFLAGADHGESREQWAGWWKDNAKGFELGPEAQRAFANLR